MRMESRTDHKLTNGGIFFPGFCVRELYDKNKRGWAILTDTDEFVTFNYRYPETEDPTEYDSGTKHTSRAIATARVWFHFETFSQA